MAAAGKMANDTTDAFWMFEAEYDESPLRFPYALFLTGLGGIVAWVGVVLAVLVMVRTHRGSSVSV